LNEQRDLAESLTSLEMRSAALVERRPDGTLRVPEGSDAVAGVGTAAGGLMGMLAGVLGGPLGVLLGFGTGALVGGAFDLDRATRVDDALALLSAQIPPGSTSRPDQYRGCLRCVGEEFLRPGRMPVAGGQPGVVARALPHPALVQVLDETSGPAHPGCGKFGVVAVGGRDVGGAAAGAAVGLECVFDRRLHQDARRLLGRGEVTDEQRRRPCGC
jgi:hypothetical protein